MAVWSGAPFAVVAAPISTLLAEGDSNDVDLYGETISFTLDASRARQVKRKLDRPPLYATELPS